MDNENKSLYAKYLAERESFNIIETDKGFASWKYYPKDKEIYVRDIYVLPEYRRMGIGSEFVDRIVKIAKDNNCDSVTTSAVPSANNSSISMLAILKYGFQILRSENNFIAFIKRLNQSN